MSYVFYRNYLQLSHQTKVDRFPKIFARLKELKPQPKRVLSFGCSTGEECLTLGKVYPNSEIVGFDIDYYCIDQARMVNKNPRITFTTDLSACGEFDVITCMMVLFSLECPILFSAYKKAILLMDQHLSLRGLLAIYTAEYDFRKLAIANKYEVIRAWQRNHPRSLKRYFNGYFSKKECVACETSSFVCS